MILAAYREMARDDIGFGNGETRAEERGPFRIAIMAAIAPAVGNIMPHREHVVFASKWPSCSCGELNGQSRRGVLYSRMTRKASIVTGALCRG